MRLLFLFFGLLLSGFSVGAQDQAPIRYSVTAFSGITHMLAERGPRGNALGAKMKWVLPVKETLLLELKGNISPRWSLGLGGGYQEFDYGYDLVGRNGAGLASGQLGSEIFIRLLKIYPIIGYRLLEKGRWTVGAELMPTIGYYPYDQYALDTSGNSWWRDPYSEGYTQYLKQPSIQYNKPVFLAGLGLRADLRLGKRQWHGFTFGIRFQQGFRPFLTDSTLIIRRDINPHRQAMHYTVLRGTGISYMLGYSFFFRKPDS